MDVMMGMRDLLYSEQRLDEAREGAGGAPEGVAESDRVLGVVTELGIGGGVAIAAGFANGDARLFFSSGGGLIGDLSQFPGIDRAARALVATGQLMLDAIPEAEGNDLPGQDMVRFALLTPGGIHAATAPGPEVTSPGSPLYPLFVAANDLLTELRLVEEQTRQRGT
ncbi:MAG TPA: hypothetical protein VFR15_06265 [Chloroflexia bacterium]|nr:hypothetical protein [Chloroflexia bacterium]